MTARVRVSGLRPWQRLVYGQSRLRALISGLSVTLVTLLALDFAAVTALHSYLPAQTDSTLRTAVQLNDSSLSTVSPATPAVLDRAARQRRFEGCSVRSFAGIERWSKSLKVMSVMGSADLTDLEKLRGGF